MNYSLGQSRTKSVVAEVRIRGGEENEKVNRSGGRGEGQGSVGEDEETRAGRMNDLTASPK